MTYEPAKPLVELKALGDRPLVTIIIASYNQEKYIADTITSVLNQDYDNIELIVVDGGSTDGTMDIVHGYEKDPRISSISEPDGGPNDAFKKGLKLATGSLIGFLLSSDTYTPWAVQEAVEEFSSDPNLAFVGGWVGEIDDSGKPNGETWKFFDERFYYSVDNIVTLKNYPPEQSTFFRCDIALAIDGGGLEFKWLHTFFFLHYMLEASRRGAQSLSVPRHWANYRRHPEPLSQDLSRLDVGLTVLRERNLACKQISMRYKDLLTSEQVRELRRPGYLRELRYRVGTLHQIGPAIPALWRYFRFGGKPSHGNLRPQKKSWLSYLASFIMGQFFKRAPKSRTDPRLK